MSLDRPAEQEGHEGNDLLTPHEENPQRPDFMSGVVPAPASYVIITPVRNEAAFLPSTIESVLLQTVRPMEWIIVDDGSTDETGKIIDESAQRYPWIRGVHRKDRGFREPGGGVVAAFNDGYRMIGSRRWDFIVKLDGDLSLKPNYFEKCFEYFRKEPKLGIGGGSICYLKNGEEVVEECPRFHVRGATKIYRRECWDAVGGLWPAPGWDTMDEVKANMLGWTTRSFADVRLVQHRATGSSEGVWKGLVKDGRADYICGYHPLFMFGKCIRRLVFKPWLIGSFGMFYGYITGYLKRIPQVDDAVIAYLRRQQLGRLFGRETIWR